MKSMNRALHTGHRAVPGFTLMEVVVSIGILAVALSSIAATIGYSSKRAAESSRKAQAVWLLDGMLSEVRDAIRSRQSFSALHRIETPASMPATEELWFNGEGLRVEKRDDAVFRCRLEFRADPSSAGLFHLHGRITWPAAVREGREKGSAELLTSILRS
jgi:type II secretory pathway pseudopilin PulG